MRFLILNGPNLNMLGTRETDVYGNETLRDLENRLRRRADKLRVDVAFKQTNHEGEIVDSLHRAAGRFEGIVLNAGAYTHTSIAIRDAVAAIDVPVVEVHISNIYGREKFRHKSLLAPVCAGCIIGMGSLGYELAMMALTELAEEGERARPARDRGRDRDRDRGRPERAERAERPERAERVAERDRADEGDEEDEDRRGRGRRQRGRRGGRGRDRDREKAGRGREDREREEREEWPSPAERYENVKDVRVRSAADVLSELESEEDLEHVGEDFVSFGGDEDETPEGAIREIDPDEVEDSRKAAMGYDSDLEEAPAESETGDEEEAEEGKGGKKKAAAKRARKKAPAKKKAAKTTRSRTTRSRKKSDENGES